LFAAATALDKSKKEEKPEQQTAEPWRRGRGGTSLGRAVHAVLQSIDLATGEGLEERARAQAVAEGIPDREDVIIRLVRAAVGSEIVGRAVASGRLWREVPVATPVGSGSLDGFIDLLFEEADGLVLVGYKTDSVPAQEAQDAVARYRLQGGAYAYAIGKATGKPVKQVVFLYLQPRQEVTLEDVPQAMQEAAAAAEKLLGPASG
jgi:ATP-dependent helicase/nuclease subunit A